MWCELPHEPLQVVGEIRVHTGIRVRSDRINILVQLLQLFHLVEGCSGSIGRFFTSCLRKKARKASSSNAATGCGVDDMRARFAGLSIVGGWS